MEACYFYWQPIAYMLRVLRTDHFASSQPHLPPLSLSVAFRVCVFKEMECRQFSPISIPIELGMESNWNNFIDVILFGVCVYGVVIARNTNQICQKKKPPVCYFLRM